MNNVKSIKSKPLTPIESLLVDIHADIEEIKRRQSILFKLMDGVLDYIPTEASDDPHPESCASREDLDQI
jgi:hypothetical protein